MVHQTPIIVAIGINTGVSPNLTEYTMIDSSVDSETIDTVDDDINTPTNKQRTIPKLSLKDVFVEGR